MSPLRIAMVGVVLSLLVGVTAHAQEVSSEFEAANALAYQGDYKAAVVAYEAIVSSGMNDPALFLNLGNAHYRSDAFGAAIWSFRRGLQCEPEETLAESLAYNLEISRRALQARYRASNDGSQFIYTEPGGWLYQLSHTISFDGLLWAFLGLWWVLCVLLIVRRYSARAGIVSLAIPLGVMTVLVGALLLARIVTDQEFKLGVIISDDVVMREGPDVHARGVDVPEGMEVRLVDETTGWHKVEIPSGRSGWVDAATLRPL